jgi:hypothetical protein
MALVIVVTLIGLVLGSRIRGSWLCWALKSLLLFDISIFMSAKLKNDAGLHRKSVLAQGTMVFFVNLFVQPKRSITPYPSPSPA